jgi:hypothetical protein
LFFIPSNTFTISYENNNGIGSMEDQDFQGDSSVTLSTNTFARKNSEFVRWDTEASGTGDIQNWGDKNNIFISIAMKIDSSASCYYGYIEVSFDNDPGLLTIHSIAYMNDEGASITAGQKP